MHKFYIDRKSLKIIYTSFNPPLLEYTDVIWDNCLRQVKQELEKIQTEAARIAGMATELDAIQKFNEEACWKRLETRRWKHRLVLFHKMLNYVSSQQVFNPSSNFGPKCFPILF